MSDIRRQHLSVATLVSLVGVILLSLIATGLSGYLWYRSAELHAGGLVTALPGCADTDLVSCGEVLASRWSMWLNVPLAAAGTINYLLLMVVAIGLVRSGSRGLWAAALLLAGVGTLAGIWLVIVQAVYIHKFCLYCDIVHAAGLLSLILLWLRRPADLSAALRAGPMGLAVAATVVLVVGQVYFKPEVKPIDIVATQPSTQPAGTVAAGTQGATSQGALASMPASRPANAFDVTDAAGTVLATLDLDNEIILGDPKASKLLVEFLDFGCHECKGEFELMQQILKKHPDWFRLMVLFYPGNKSCNPATSRDRPNVCEVAQAAVALGKHSPQHYEKAHALFFQLQDTPLTGGMAWELIKQMVGIDEATAQSWQNDPTLLEKIKRHCDALTALLGTQKEKKVWPLPVLYANGKILAGASETQADLQKHITQLIGPPPAAAASR